jgi:hypothetical protein
MCVFFWGKVGGAARGGLSLPVSLSSSLLLLLFFVFFVFRERHMGGVGDWVRGLYAYIYIYIHVLSDLLGVKGCLWCINHDGLGAG